VTTADLFHALKQRSLKLDNFFPIYDRLFERYRHREHITIVEVGVRDGGSLELWRALFPNARIIGVDIMPAAALMRQQGFEIYIADQCDPVFWENFYRDIGPIDILIDDGAHTNRAQIVTVEAALPHVRDGGLILVEDTVTSYLAYRGNPSRYSFVNYAQRMIAEIAKRSEYLADRPRSRFTDAVWTVQFFDSIVAIEIDRRLCGRSSVVVAGQETLGAVGYDNKPLLGQGLRRRVRGAARVLGLEKSAIALYDALKRWQYVIENQRLGRYFR